jgi:glycosyltransferase involved in cell wall biosynthesis
MSDPQIAFVSREVYPFGGGGMGNYVTFSAGALAEHAEVTIITSTLHERRYQELHAAGDCRLPRGVRFEFVPEPLPKEIGGWYGPWHLWSARAFDAVVRLYPDGGPDLVEFPDYLGEGCVTVQAAQTGDRRLRRALVCVRFYTTAEMAWVLDGRLDRDLDTGRLINLERYGLRYADRLVSPGPAVLDTYRRFYGDRGLAPASTVRHVVAPEATPPSPGPRSGPIKALYAGRLERRKGVQDLVRAATALQGDDWSLVLVGADTPTAPLSVSMRKQLELMIDGDERIEIRAPVDRDEVIRLVGASDFVVSPSLWECWPNAVLEALQANRPVLATPVGGQAEMVRPDRSGWLTAEVGTGPLHELLRSVTADRGPIAELVDAGSPRRQFEELTDADSIVASYLRLCEERPRDRPLRGVSAATASAPLVSVVMPYFHMARFIGQALESVFAQSYDRLEVVVVNDGSLEKPDRALAELADRYPIRVVTQPNSGLGQARNLGIAVSTGRYVLPLDPDNLLAPSFVQRCVDVLESRPEIAYVTSWSRYIDDGGDPLGPGQGYQPLGNAASKLENENVAGDAIAAIRRRYFDLGFAYSPDMTSYEDWLLYRQLRAAGFTGHVIPERLIDYRVRAKSMLREIAQPNEEQLLAEMDARVIEREIEWTSSSG